ncbi:MAG: histidine phosphatase family protein, partial [Haliea sp.]
MQQDWPKTLWIVRHGQSAGNVARDSAEAAGLHTIDIAERDIDVPLSEL